MKNTNPWIDNPVLFRSVIRDNYENFVDKLFEHKALIDVPNIYGENLLHYVCFLGMVDKYEALLNFGAKVKETQEGNTLLHYSSYSGHNNYMVTDLVKSGFDPLHKNHNGQTSIHLAGNETICQYFSMWLDTNRIKVTSLLDNMGNTVAHTSLLYGRINSYTLWLKEFPELKDVKNHNGETPETIQFRPQRRFCTLIDL